MLGPGCLARLRRFAVSGGAGLDPALAIHLTRVFTDALLVQAFYSGFRVGVAAVWLGFVRQGWITAFAAVLLALIALLTSTSHVDLLGAASADLPQ